MAAAWGKPAGGAWADDVDEQEQKGTLAAPTLGAPLALKEDNFPSLSAAKEAPSKKKAKAKPVALGAFLAAGPAGGAARANLDEKSILLSLPKGSSGAPREEAGAGGLGGAFKDYGGQRDGAWDVHMPLRGGMPCDRGRTLSVTAA